MKLISAIIGWLLERFGRKAQVADDQAQVIKDVEARNAVEMDVAREPDPVGVLRRDWTRD